jgi:hypothetical protein
MFNTEPQNIELDVLLAIYDFIKYKIKPDASIEPKMLAFLDNLKFLAVHNPNHHVIFKEMEQSFLIMKTHYLAQNPQPRMVLPDCTDLNLNADLMAAEFYVYLARHLLANIPESKNTNFIKFLVYQNAVPNDIKAKIVSEQNIEKQQILLRWVLFNRKILSYYLTERLVTKNGQTTTTLYLTDLFVFLNKKPELAEFVDHAAKIIAECGSQYDKDAFKQAYPHDKDVLAQAYPQVGITKRKPFDMA